MRPRISILEKALLTDGSEIQVTRLGNRYAFNRLFLATDDPPITCPGLSKGVAYGRFVKVLRADVLESD